MITALFTLLLYQHFNGMQTKAAVYGGGRYDVITAPLTRTSMQVQEVPDNFTYAAEKTVHAVVHVRVRSVVTGDEGSDDPLYEFFYGNNARQQPRKVTGFGSGVIISPDGYIITNNHVVEGADSIQVTLNNNKTYIASLVGRDPDTDIALIKIKEENLPVIKYGDSDKLMLGDWVLAVGNPFNLTSTVTAGIVSAKGRSLDVDGSYKIESFIQTDAALNMGNSGGALVNPRAELVGITSAIISPTGTYSGNSFAIPVNIVKKAVSDLRLYGKVQRPILGINVQEVTSDIAQKAKLAEVSGAYVASVSSGGSAEEAGIKEKDIIVKIDGTNIKTPAELQEVISEHHPGDKINLTYIRGGKESTVPVELKNIDGTTGIVYASMGETVLGAKVASITSQDKKKYNIDFGAKVIDIGAGKLSDLGIRKGTIIMTVNGHVVNSASDMRDATSDGENLSSIEGILPNGAGFSYQYKN